MTHTNCIANVDEARDYAIDWSNWVGEQNLSYGRLLEFQAIFAELVERFPELEDEFRENGII